MLSFFKPIRDVSDIRIPSGYNDVKRTLHEHHQALIKYWRHMNWSVKSDHILVKALNSVSSIHHNPFEIYRSIRESLNGAVMGLGICNYAGYGRVQSKSWFYDPRCPEVLVEQPFDDALEQIITKPVTEWETCRVISHPFTSLDYQLPNGKTRVTGEHGLCVIKIDLALLYTQYKLWRMNDSLSKYSDGVNKSMMNFIHNYPVVNMLRSQTERVWFNRILHLGLGLPVDNHKPDNRPAITTPYTQLDRVHEKLIEMVEGSREDFHNWCCWIPGIWSKNLKQFMIQDNVLETQQLKMCWDLGRLLVLRWLFKTEVDINTGSNTMYRNEYLKKFREYKYGRTFGTIRGLSYDSMLQLYTDEVSSLAEQVR